MHSKISVIIPCYNSEKTICKTLNSIENQVLDDSILLEILVIDNASTDNTKSIIQEYKSLKYRIQYLYEPIKNRSKARNAGIKFSKSEYLVFVDSDVELQSDWISIMYSKIHSSPSYGGGEGHIEPKILFKENYIEKIRKIIKTNSNVMLGHIGKKFPMINTAACVYRKSALLDAGLLDESLNYLEDIDLSRSVFFSGYALFATEKAKSTCYNDSPTFFSFLKRNFVSGKEFYKYSKKWSYYYPDLNTSGYFFAIASNIFTNFKVELFQKRNISVALARTIFYFSSGLGYLISQLTNNNLNRTNLKARAQIINEEGPYGIVELDNKYILHNFKDKSFKSIFKVFPIDVLFQKYNVDLFVHSLQFVETLVQDYISIYMVGSHSKHDQSVFSRKDIDLVIIVNDDYSAGKINNKIKSLKPVIAPKLDIVAFSRAAIEDCNIFHNQGIKAANYAMHFATLLAGKEFKRKKIKHKTNTDGLQLYYLYFKKIYYYIITKQQNFIGHMHTNNVDLIDLYKVLSYLDLELTEEFCKPSDELYYKNINMFKTEESKFLTFLESKRFTLSLNDYKNNEQVINKITFKAINIFLKNYDSYIENISPYIHSCKCTKEYYDYNFLNIDSNTPIRESDYPGLMLERTKLCYDELAQRLKC